MNFTEKIYPKSNRPVAVIFTSLLVTALFCCCTITSARAAVLFDNISNFENSAPGADITSTASTPNTFMGAGYNLISGADAITGFDIFPGNLSGVNFNALRITMYVWGTVNTSGTVNSSTPAFGNLLATYTLDATGAFNSGFYFPFEGAATGVDPGLILGTPLSIPGTLIGITFNYQGSTDGGVTFNNVNSLTSVISYGTPASIGSLQFNGYYRNASSETTGNFISALRSLGLTDQGLAVRIYGTTSGGGNNQPLANSQSVTLIRDTPTSITLTGSDPDPDPLTFNVATQPTHGLLSGTAPNLTYTPDLSYVGVDSFTFTVNDTHTDSVPATVSLTINPPPNGLVIIPVWHSSITSDPNAAAIMATINTAIQVYQTKYRDPVTVTIQFQEGGGLGSSSTYVSSTSYANFYNALVADSKTTNDTVALANVPGGSVNPVDGSTTMGLTTANFRALGFNVNPPAGQPDSTITLNMSIINITRPPVNPNNYDLQAVVSHEIDEALGTISGVGGATTRPADLFRYSSPGVRNYTTAGDSANFSINGGTTMLVKYNQNNSGDYGDWWSIGAHTPRVQDAFATPAATPNLGVELTLLDVIGWDLAPPAPPAVFQSVNIAGGQINFIWAATYGRTYQVQSTTSLNPQNWQNTGSPVIASGPTASYSESISGPQKFYRVALLPQPVPPPPPGLAAADKILTGPLHLETRYLLPAPGTTAPASLDSPGAHIPEPVKPAPFQQKVMLVK